MKTVIYQQYTKPPVVEAQAESITVDKWSGVRNDTVARKRNASYLYPVTPTIDSQQLTQGEQITPDKWLGSFPDIIFDKARLQYLLAKSVDDPKQLATPEEVELDKWIGTHPDIIFDRKRLQRLYQSLFIDPYQLTQNESVTIDRWLGVRSDYVFKKPNLNARVLFGAQNIEPITAGEEITVDKWHVLPKMQLKRKVTNYFTYPFTIFDYLPIPNTAPINMPAVHIIFTKHHQYQMWAAPIETPAAPSFDPSTSRVDFYSEPPLSRWQKQKKYSSAAISPWLALTDIAPRHIVFIGQQNVIISYPETTLYQSVFNPPPRSIIPETITLDKWHKEPNLPRWDRERLQFMYPSFSTDLQSLVTTEGITLDKWWREAARPVWDKKRAQQRFPTFFIDPTTLLQLEPITLDKWFREAARPRWDRKRLQYMYPEKDFRAETEVVVVETVTLDKWLGRYPDKLFDKKRNQFAFPFESRPVGTQLVEDLKLDKWAPSYPSIVFDRVRNQHLYPFQFVYATVTILVDNEVQARQVWVVKTVEKAVWVAKSPDKATWDAKTPDRGTWRSPSMIDPGEERE